MTGVVVRPAEPADARSIAEVRIDAWRSTYRGLVPDASLDAMSVGDSAAFWERILASGSSQASVFVAVERGTLVGFAAANVRHPPVLGFDAELSATYVAAPWKRRGIGERLVAAVAAAQRARGAQGLVAWVLAKNREARAFYEAMGGELIGEQPFQWEGADLVESAYAFRDLDALAARACDNPALH